jgi:cyclohexadieny/prephenate dehydrogenase
VTVMFEKIALIGLGLLGSSLSHASRRSGLSKSISGYARSVETRATAVEIGIVDTVHDTAAAAVVDADLVILCSPVGTYAELAKDIAPHLKAGCILSDVGSVKGAVVRDVAPHLPLNVHFIPGHPIAGTEQSGPRAGFATLFDNRWCILTPPPHANVEAVAKLRRYWEALGSMVDEMTPEHHDLVLAITSHLPHLIAYNTVATASDLEEVTKSEVIKYSAGGFRDFTRIAASDPTMWRDVFLNNKEAVLEMLGRFSEELSVLQRAIRWGDGETLFDLFTRARDVRRGIIQAGQDTAAPDFGRGPAPKA